jgi:FkbM family methyltransferase
VIAYCLGLQASGSTWLYNVVRGIFAAAGVEHAALRVEEPHDIDNPMLHRARHAVMRAHNASSQLLRLLQATDARAILSFRDPRDCVTSSMQRFGRPLVPVSNDIVRNLASLHAARAALPNLTFVYEDDFTRTVETLHRCADFLGLTITGDQAAAIFDAYRPESIAARFASCSDLRTFRNVVTGIEVDVDTSFHRGHITDGRVGKWRDRLEPSARAAVQTLFGGASRLPDAGATAPALTFGSELFRPVDSMLDYTRALTVAELTGPLGVKALSDIYLPRGLWRLRLSVDGSAGPLSFQACQNGEVIHQGTIAAGGAEFVWMNVLHDHPFDFHLAGPEVDALAAAAPPPPCALHAALLCDDAALRPGITETGLVRPEPAAAVFAAPAPGTPEPPPGLSRGERALRRVVLLHRALRRPGTVVDIGAFCGDVGLALAGTDTELVAIEPLAEAAIELRRRARGRAVRVIEVALGAQPGAAVPLHVPLLRGAPVWAWASTAKDFAALARAHPEITGTLALSVPRARLDDLGLADVTAIHVNAQGAEAAVLRGARQTLRQARPLLTVEIEERHAPGATRAVPAWLAELGYDGYFELDGVSRPIAAFDPATLQVSGRSPTDENYSEPYVNCFYFLPRENLALCERFHARYSAMAPAGGWRIDTPMPA